MTLDVETTVIEFSVYVLCRTCRHETILKMLQNLAHKTFHFLVWQA